MGWLISVPCRHLIVLVPGRERGEDGAGDGGREVRGRGGAEVLGHVADEPHRSDEHLWRGHTFFLFEVGDVRGWVQEWRILCADMMCVCKAGGGGGRCVCA